MDKSEMSNQGDTASITEPTEKKKLIEKEHKVSLKEAAKLRIWALVISYFSIITTLVIGVLSLVIGFQENSTASYAFAITAIVDCLTSAVVIWRYKNKDLDLYDADRERKACLVLGVIFIISFVTSVSYSTYNLITGTPPQRSDILWHVSLANAVICLLLALIKFYLGYELESLTIITDGLNSLLGMVISAAILISSLVYERHNSVWFLDGLIGLVVSFIVFAYGVKLLVKSCASNQDREGMEMQSKPHDK